jgi:hypothetical protein
MKTAAVRTLLSAFLTVVPLAQAVPATRGDLILGFKAASGLGGDVNLEVNLGPAADFYNAPAGSATVLTRLSVQDLVETYGADWNTRSDLFWGVAGTTGISAVGGVPARTIWASRAESTPGMPSAAWTRGTTSALQNPSNTISTLYTGAPGSIDRFAATANSAFSSKSNAALTGSWTAQEGVLPGVSFQYFNPSVMNAINTFPAANSAYDGTAYTVLDLWEVRPTTTPGSPATLIGGIGINSAGKLVFSRDVTKFAPPSTPEDLSQLQPVITYNANNTVTVSLAEVPGGSYVLRRSTTLAGGSWTTLFTQSPVAGTLTYVDPNPPQPRGFYVIGVAP